jgi:hypothetical protein
VVTERTGSGGEEVVSVVEVLIGRTWWPSSVSSEIQIRVDLSGERMVVEDMERRRSSDENARSMSMSRLAGYMNTLSRLSQIS